MSLAITGSPYAIASSRATDNPSMRDGRRNASALE
jgi:hypothetical protein